MERIQTTIWVKQKGNGAVVQTPYDISKCQDGNFWAFGLARVEHGYELVEVAIVRNVFDENGNERELNREIVSG
jgi:hypothetical protein